MSSAALTLRVVAGLLELRCRCGLVLTQALRDPIADRCPKCGAGWGRGRGGRDDAAGGVTMAAAVPEAGTASPPATRLWHRLAHGGVRLGEAIALRWGDIDWRTGTMLVSRAYSHGRLDVPKGGKARKVELSSRLRATLRAAYEARFERVVALDADQQAALEAEQATTAAAALVFPDETGGYPDDANLRRRLWAPLLEAAELRYRRLHDLRHTFATLHLQGGTDPLWVSAQLGHHSVAFTLSTYAHLPRNDRGGHADRIDPTAPKCTQSAPGAATTVSESGPGCDKGLEDQGLCEARPA